MAMTRAKQVTDTPSNYDPTKPKHMIIWLDEHIGKPDECMHLKKAFGSNTDPRHTTWTMLTDKDYDALLVGKAAVIVNFEGVIFLLQAFDKEDDCLEAFEKNQDKRIFFITSGSMGKKTVPKIIERFPHVFTDLITNEPYSSVYVFCLHIEYHMEWGMKYAKYVQMFNTESELLERMTRDIAEYFITRGERLRKDDNLRGAVQHIHWAKKLWYQYDKMQQQITTDSSQAVRESQGMIKINALIAEVDAQIAEAEALIAKAKEELSNELANDENASSDDEGKGYEPE
jgi:hypothetical protein